MIKWVQKRDGRLVPFLPDKIADAIFAAAKAVGGEDRLQAEVLAGQVIHLLQQNTVAQEAPQVEAIQDLVEKVLIEEGHARTAKAFILYRNKRTRIREAKSELMDAVSEIFQEAGTDLKFVSTPLGKLQRIAVAASERYTLNNLLPRDFSLAHQRRRIHIDRLAHYATSIAAVGIDLRPLLTAACQIGEIQVPQLQELRDLEQAVQAVIVAAQNETMAEILLADLDVIFVDLCRQQNLQPDGAAIKQLAERLIAGIHLILAPESGQQLKVCISFGRAQDSLGQGFTTAMLKLVRQDIVAGRPYLLPQLVLQIAEDINLLPHDPGYQLALLAKDIAKQKGNPSFVLLEADAPAQPYYLASGTQLPANRPALISRTFVNIPRLALEAESAKDFLAIIDAAFSLVARQMVHRFEVLTALQPLDLPLAVAQLCGPNLASADLPFLAGSLLLIVPVGISAALHVARHRFSSSFAVSDQEFIDLLQNICEHWRNYYSLNLQIGAVPSLTVARQFFDADAAAFPLIANLYPDTTTYESYVNTDSKQKGLLGGQLDVWTGQDYLRPGIVYTQASIDEKNTVLEDGYLVPRTPNTMESSRISIN